MQPSAVVVGIDLLAALGCLLTAAVAWRRRTASGAYAFVTMTLAISWWCVWSALALTRSPELAYIYLRLTWLGVAISLPAYLAFVTLYVGGGVHLSWRWALVLGLEPLLTILAILTNDWLHLVWTSVWLAERGYAVHLVDPVAPTGLSFCTPTTVCGARWMVTHSGSNSRRSAN